MHLRMMVRLSLQFTVVKSTIACSLRHYINATEVYACPSDKVVLINNNPTRSYSLILGTSIRVTNDPSRWDSENPTRFDEVETDTILATEQ